jgi:Tfp pilus assembly protein PilF
LPVGFAVLALCAPGWAGRRELRGTYPSVKRWQREVRRHDVDPDTIVNPLAYTREMRDAALEVAGYGTPLDRLRRLQAFLFNEDLFPFDYESTLTYSATEAFEQRTGNCVSFTNLFLALARSIDVPVKAALVMMPGDAEKEGDLVVVHNHIVAIYEHSGGATVFDFNRRRDRPRIRLSIIGDAEITAIYLNNLGAEALLAGNPTEALDYVEKAVLLAPEFALARGNLGVVHRQLGDVPGALEAYRLALNIVPDDATILNNLAALYQAEGRHDEARAVLRAVDRRAASPYLLIVLGDIELSRGDEDKAMRLYKRAARQGRDLPEPQIAIARALIAEGRTDAARKRLRKALARDAGNETARDLLRRLEEGG